MSNDTTAPQAAATARPSGRLDTVIVGACALFVAMSIWGMLTPDGDPLPVVPQILISVALFVVLMGHMAKHLGAKLMLAFVGTTAVIEWAFEQSNISFDGFIWGDIRYGDLVHMLGPMIGDVPLLVPLMMAVILWPTYACVNILLDGKVVVDHRALTVWQNVWRAVLYGMVHSWYMFLCNSLAVEWGIYEWVGRSLEWPAEDFFFGDPTAPRGWAIYVIVSMLIFAFVMVPWLGREAVARAADRPLVWADVTPAIFLGVMALMIYLNPVDQTSGNVVMWTLGFFAILTGYRFVDVMRAQKLTAMPPTGPAPTEPGAPSEPSSTRTD